jgi:hypothetical protein
MTDSHDGSMDALHQLLTERAKFEAWLQQLDARRGAAPAHVLERVRHDYQGRLDQVTTQLRGRAVELEATVAALRSRLAALASEEESKRDERAETELRATVGEYSPDEARSTIQGCDAVIASLTAQRDALGSELARLQEVLVLVVPPPAPHPPSVLEPVAAPADPQVVVDEITEEVEAVQPAAVAEPPAPQPEVSSVARDELEFLRSVVSAPGANPPAPDLVSPPVLTAPRRQATPMSSTAINGTIRDPLRAAGGESGMGAGNMAAFLRDMPTEQVKTLKCQECGTMNFPTEWYCERCGGELAAM